MQQHTTRHHHHHVQEDDDDQRLLLSGTLASDGDFSETESFGSPIVRPHDSARRHRYDEGDHGSAFAPAVLPAGHRKSLNSSHPKIHRYVCARACECACVSVCSRRYI
jgi:hypothetical protein